MTEKPEKPQLLTRIIEVFLRGDNAIMPTIVTLTLGGLKAALLDSLARGLQ